MSEGGGFGGESLYLQVYFTIYLFDGTKGLLIIKQCPRLDEERDNAYANFANRAQENYQIELQAHNDLMDEYRRKLEYTKTLQRMSSDYDEEEEDSSDYTQAMSVPARTFPLYILCTV